MLPFVSEADRFLPTAAGVHLSGINAATLAAQQGGLAGSASDYMRLAMPVRDPDNGDAISGSGECLLLFGCCVFQPAFGCCAHLKAGQNTFFGSFQTFYLISNFLDFCCIF